MDEATKRKFNANIKAVNGDLVEILEERLPTDELIKLKFEGIRILIDDCERLALKENKWLLWNLIGNEMGGIKYDCL